VEDASAEEFETYVAELEPEDLYQLVQDVHSYIHF